MVYMGKRSTKFAPRVASDTGEFKSLDKLDKWIYLEPTAEILKKLSVYDEWQDVPLEVTKGHWKQDTRHELELHNLKPNDLAHKLLTPTVVAETHKHVLRSGIIKTHVTDGSWRKMITMVTTACERALVVQLEHLLGGVDNDLFNINNELIDLMIQKIKVIPPLIGKYWCVAEDMLHVIAERKKLYQEKYRTMSSYNRVKRRFDDMKRMGNESPFVIELPSIKGQILMTHDINILSFKNFQFILNEDLLLEVCNKMIECFCALLYNHIQSGTILPENQYHSFETFLQIIVNVYTRSKPPTVFNYKSSRVNFPFKFGKAMECLGVAFMIRTEDLFEGWMNDRLLVAMWRELYLLGVVTTASIDDHDLGKLFANMSTPQIADIIGTIKLFGHPSIEIDLGSNQLYERTHADLAIDPQAVQAGMGVIIRDLIKAFLVKHKRFPIIELQRPDLDPQIREIFERRLWPDSAVGQRLWSAITPLQWSTVTLGQNAEFDPVDNQLVLIKDKALGLTRSQIWYLLLEDAPEDRKDQAIKLLRKRELRRTLLAFLSDADFSRTFAQYFHNYADQDPWSNAVLDYLVIKLTAKELELKDLGRFFGASPLVERNRRNVQEHNTKLLMSDLVNEQLMTQDELGIMRKLLSFRYFGNVYPECYLYQISFDFSKWNNNFRRASVDIPGSHILDRWFGTNIYGKTMQAYEESLVYLREENFTRYWEGQLGGIEGLNQDTWSFIFLGGIKHALDEAGFRYQVTVKGDDVRAVIAVPEAQVGDAQDFDRIRDIILTRLQELCQSMGWQLNPQESFVSLTLIATSKQYQMRQTWLPAASKKIMKMMSLSNLLFPTLEDLVGSIFSCAHSACSQATAGLPAFVSALFVACWELYRGFQTEGSITSDELAVLAMWPQILGGPGSLPLQTFFVRGENDMLSVSLSLFCSIIRYHNGSLRPAAENILKQTLDREPDNKLLISDPYSISLNIPERPSSLLKRLIRGKLKKWVRNEDIKRLLSDVGEKEEGEFIKSLSSMTPYLAKVATVIFECSPFYLIEEVLAKFMESPTVIALFSQGKLGTMNMKAVTKALSQVIAASIRRKKYWYSVIKGRIRSDRTYLGLEPQVFADPLVCPTGLAQRVRNTAWKKEIIGITYPSLTTQLIISPAMRFNRTWPDWNIHDLCYNINIYADRAEYQTNLPSQHYAAYGDQKPWEGTETAAKVKMPRMENLVRTPTLNKISKLILLHQMLGNLGPQIRRALKSCLNALTTVNLDDIIMLMPRGEAGHVGHRLAINAFSTTTMPNFRHNLLQLLRISDEHLTITKVDRTDRTINFVAIHFYLACIALFPLQMSERLPPNYPIQLQAMFHPDDSTSDEYSMCRHCCCPLDDNFVITFNHPFPENLFKFSLLKLVGCSNYETNALIRAKADLVMTKARATARQHELDPNDPLAIEEAANTVLSQLTDQSLTILRAAVTANYFRVPTGPLLDTVKANIGLSSLTSISITVLQAIPASPLYRCLVVCLATFVLENIANTWNDHGIFDIELIAPFLNPLKHLFTKLINAGVMDRVVSGSMEVGWIDPPFSISGGDLTSPSKCSISFLLAHKQLFKQWIDGHLLGIRFVPVINMESDEEIKAVLLRNYESRLRAIVHVLLSTCPTGKATTIIMNVLSRLMQFYPPRGYTVRDHIQQLCINRPLFVDGNLRVLVLGLLTNNIMTDDDDNIYAIENVSAIIRMILAVNVHWICPPGEWFNLEARELERGMAYNIIESNLVNAEPQLLPRLDDELPANITSFIQATSAEFYDIFRQSIGQIWDNIIFAEGVMARSATRVFNILTQNLDNWIIPYQEVLINAVTEEESYRVLRIHGRQMMNDPVNRSRLVTDIAQLRAEATRNAQNQQAYMFFCNASGRREHDEVLRINYQRPQPIYNVELHHQYIRGTVQGLVNPVEYTQVENLYIDPVEITRAIGRHNTSISKYIEIFNKISLQDRIQELGGEQPLSICLADGLGGVTAYLVQIHPNAKVIYNSLLYDQASGKPMADCGINQEPIETLEPFIRSINQDSVLYRGFGDGDLSKQSVQDLIIDQNRRINGQPIIITLDADINWSDSLANYYQMFWGGLRIAVQTMTPNTVCIFKTFILQDEGLHNIFAFLYNSFSHVHIYRSQATRQHSSEIFLIFANPRNIDTLGQDLDSILSLRVHYPYNNAVVGLVNLHTHLIMRDLNLFRQDGLANHVLNLRTWVNMVASENGYPMRMDVILRWLGINPDDNPTCYCNIWMWIFQHSVRCWQNLTQEIFQDNQGRRRNLPEVRSIRGKSLAAGRAFLRYVSLRIVCLAVVRTICVLLMPCQGRFDFFDEIGPIMDDIYTLIVDGLRLTLVNEGCELIYNRGYLFRRDRKYQDCLSNIVRQAVHKLQSLGGCMLLVNSCLAGQHPEMQGRYIRAFHQGLQVRDCCFERAQAMWRRDSRAEFVTNGFPVIWDENYHLFEKPDINYMRHGRLQLTTLVRARNELVHEDEEAHEQVQCLQIDEPYV